MLQPTRIRFPIPILSSPDDRRSGHRTLHLVNPDRYVVELARRSPGPDRVRAGHDGIAATQEGSVMVDYDRSTALVVVDLQNDFADPKGSLYVGEGERIVPLVNRELEGALAADALVVYTQDWHPAQTPHFQSGGGVWPEHCVQYTWGAQLHPDLQVAGEVVRKGQGGEDGYSGFTVRDPVTGEEAATPLEGLLRRRGIGRVVVVGLATDYCVKETALDAVRLGFDTVVLGGLVRAVDLQPGDGERALAAMRAAGARIEPPA
jgi:nicotinamidase/pyrazinamidase